MDPDVRHLADLRVRLHGGDGEADALCSRAQLYAASPLMRKVLASDCSLKRGPDGLLLLTLSNPRFATAAVLDVLALIHHARPPADAERRIAMLGPIDWLGIRSPAVDALADAAAQDVVAGLGGLDPPARLASLRALPETTLRALPRAAVAAFFVDAGALVFDVAHELRGNAHAAGLAARALALAGPLVAMEALAATDAPADEAARLALLALPPVLAARALAWRGALDEAMYDLVVARQMHRVPAADLVAIACFSNWPRARHAAELAHALEPQTAAAETPGDNGLRCVSFRLRRDPARACVSLRHHNVATVESFHGSLMVRNSLRHRPKENYHAFVLRGHGGATFVASAVLSGQEAHFNLDGPAWTRQENAMHVHDVYVLLVASGYTHGRPADLPEPAEWADAAARHAMVAPANVPRVPA